MELSESPQAGVCNGCDLGEVLTDAFDGQNDHTSFKFEGVIALLVLESSATEKSDGMHGAIRWSLFKNASEDALQSDLTRSVLGGIPFGGNEDGNLA